MDKIEKFLKKLSAKNREKIKEFLRKILVNDLAGLDVKKLNGFEDLYRIRSGEIRIIFRKIGSKNIPIHVDFRKDVYKEL